MKKIIILLLLFLVQRGEGGSIPLSEVNEFQGISNIKKLSIINLATDKNIREEIKKETYVLFKAMLPEIKIQKASLDSMRAEICIEELPLDKGVKVFLFEFCISNGGCDKYGDHTKEYYSHGYYGIANEKDNGYWKPELQKAIRDFALKWYKDKDFQNELFKLKNKKEKTQK